MACVGPMSLPNNSGVPGTLLIYSGRWTTTLRVGRHQRGHALPCAEWQSVNPVMSSATGVSDRRI
jgi:hypothetical protein